MLFIISCKFFIWYLNEIYSITKEFLRFLPFLDFDTKESLHFLWFSDIISWSSIFIWKLVLCSMVSVSVGCIRALVTFFKMAYSHIESAGAAMHLAKTMSHSIKFLMKAFDYDDPVRCCVLLQIFYFLFILMCLVSTSLFNV